MTQKNFKPDINFLFEMGNIRFIERMWRRFLHEDFANVAEHHFRVFWIAMTIAANEKNNGHDIDTGKIAKLCMLHDITESRVGEVDYISRQYVERNEELAIKDILNDTSVEAEFFELWAEYEARVSLESQIVKDADNLDVDFELAEQAARGSQLKEKWRPIRREVAESKIYTKTAQEIFAQLQSSDPHDWHTMSPRNRLHGGDWKR